MFYHNNDIWMFHLHVCSLFLHYFQTTNNQMEKEWKMDFLRKIFQRKLFSFVSNLTSFQFWKVPKKNEKLSIFAQFINECLPILFVFILLCTDTASFYLSSFYLWKISFPSISKWKIFKNYFDATDFCFVFFFQKPPGKTVCSMLRQHFNTFASFTNRNHPQLIFILNVTKCNSKFDLKFGYSIFITMFKLL